MLSDEQWVEYEKKFDSLTHELRVFMNNVDDFFSTHPEMKQVSAEKIHSTKKRIKDKEHLREKLNRKIDSGRDINPENMFFEITDLVGVRLLLLFQADFADVDNLIRRKINSGDWHLAERPKAYTWDPESATFFGAFDVDVINRETSYTSVHYLIRPRGDSLICCEIQVRTLFEEIWGEVDHRINYPVPTDRLACKEQILVLSKIVGAGSRLVDSIRRTMEQ